MRIKLARALLNKMKLIGEKQTLWFGALFVAVVMIGGSVDHAPIFTLLAELIAIPALLIGLNSMGSWSDGPTRNALLLILAAIAVAVLQLIPLPPAIWTALPGRSLLEEAAQLIGAENEWRPLSLDPAATRAALLFMIPPVAIFLAARRTSIGDYRFLLWLIVVVAIVHALLGLLQSLVTEAAPVYLYRIPPLGLAQGLFANRNHAADMYIIGMLAVLALMRMDINEGRADWGIWLLGAVLLLFTILVIRTLSRSGVAFLLIVLLFAWTLFTPKFSAGSRRWLSVPTAILLLGPVTVTGFFLAMPDLLQRLAGRFDPTTDLRFVFWPDVWSAAKLYFPAGSGLGTFDLVYRSVERLSTMTPMYINQAHNDYLQIMLEAGVVGVLGTLGFFVLYIRLAVRAFRGDGRTREIIFVRAAVFMMAILLLHSFVDYPLRTLALLSIFAMALGIACHPTPSRARRRIAAEPIAD